MPSIHNVPPGEPESHSPNALHRRMEITVERELLSVTYQPAANIVGRCDRCGRDVLLLSAEVAAAEHSVSPRQIYRWLDEHDLHIYEFPGGPIYICSESLKAATAKELL